MGNSVRGVVLLAGMLSSATAQAGACPTNYLQVVPATPKSVEIPPDGGLLVAADSTMDSASETLDTTKWRFSTKGKRRTKPVVTTLAPGLVRLTPAGTRLEDSKQHTLVTFTRGTTPVAALVAPAVTSLTYTRGRRMTSVTAVLTTAPADGYLVVFDAEGKTPRSWGHATSTTVAVYSAGGCHVVAGGTVPSQAGDKVRLAWVDMFGRMSPLTDPIQIASDPNPPPRY
jgi:hypothetical protein